MVLFLLLKKKISPSLLLPFHHHQNCLPKILLHKHSTSTIQENPFIVDYLIKSCGLAPEKALKASKQIPHVKSPSKPDSVIQFLKNSGWNQAQIRKFVTSDPGLLCVDLERILKPRLQALQELGFSDSELIQLASQNPRAIYFRNARRSIEFWKSILGTNERVLKAFKRNHFLFASSVETRVMPNVAFLRQCGLSDDQIVVAALQASRLFTMDSNSLEVLAAWADEFGLPRSSAMYRHVLRCLCGISRSTYDAKLEFLRSLGWSQSEIVSILQKVPGILRLSMKKIGDTVDFLVKEAGCEMSYIARSAVILAYSLEKRLIPRHFVLKMLKSKGLPMGNAGLYSAVCLADEMFLKKFVLPHEVAVPGLREAYAAACAGKVQSQCAFGGET